MTEDLEKQPEGVEEQSEGPAPESSPEQPEQTDAALEPGADASLPDDSTGDSEGVDESAQEPKAVEAEEPAEPADDADAKEPAAASTEAKGLPSLPEEGGSDIKWYVIHAHSGHENKVKQSLENRVRQERLDDLIKQVLVPSEEVAEVKGGKKRITNRKIFPGYVLVEMNLSHKTWHLVRTTPGVTGFIGSGKLPIPLEPEEITSIFEQMRGERKKPKPKVEFEKDERVKIIEGPFANFMGCVDEVNSERGKLKVMVEIFERLTSVELEFWQVEKI